MTMPEGTWTSGKVALLGFMPRRLPGVPGGGDALALPTEPGSLKPWALFSSGPSKKLRLNSLPASNDTSGVRVSGAGALPRPAVSDWSILKTSMITIFRRCRGSSLSSLFVPRSPFAFYSVFIFSLFRLQQCLPPVSRRCCLNCFIWILIQRRIQTFFQFFFFLSFGFFSRKSNDTIHFFHRSFRHCSPHVIHTFYF